MQRVVRLLLTLAGLVLGIGLALLIKQALDHFNIQPISKYQDIILFAICSLVCGFITFILSSGIIKYSVSLLKWAEGKLSEIPMMDIVFGSVGLIIGLLIAFLISDPISRLTLPWVSVIITTAIYIFFGYLGISIATKRRDELSGFSFFRRSAKEKTIKEDIYVPKILDTSVIIDGRIFDI